MLTVFIMLFWLRGFHNNSGNLTHWTADFWADFEQRIIDKAVEWRNDCGPVSMQKNSTSNTRCNFWHYTFFW